MADDNDTFAALLDEEGVIDFEDEATEALQTAPLIPEKPPEKPQNGPERREDGPEPVTVKKPDPRNQDAADVLQRGSGEFFSGIGVKATPVLTDGFAELGKIVMDESAGPRSPWVRAGVIVGGMLLASVPLALVHFGLMQEPKEASE